MVQVEGIHVGQEGKLWHQEGQVVEVEADSGVAGRGGAANTDARIAKTALVGCDAGGLAQQFARLRVALELDVGTAQHGHRNGDLRSAACLKFFGGDQYALDLVIAIVLGRVKAST